MPRESAFEKGLAEQDVLQTTEGRASRTEMGWDRGVSGRVL